MLDVVVDVTSSGRVCCAFDGSPPPPNRTPTSSSTTINATSSRILIDPIGSKTMSSAVYGVLERADEHLAHVLSQWSILTTILALAIAGLVAYNVWTWEDPDTSPFLLARQSSAAPIRNPGESAAYRSLETPHGYPLRSGLDIRDHDTPRWSPGRDGDLRDLWRSAVRGRPGPDGRPTGQTGKILTVRGREEIVEHSIGMVVTRSR